MFTFLFPRVRAISATAPGRFSTLIVNCLVFGNSQLLRLRRRVHIHGEPPRRQKLRRHVLVILVPAHPLFEFSRIHVFRGRKAERRDQVFE